LETNASRFCFGDLIIEVLCYNYDATHSPVSISQHCPSPSQHAVQHSQMTVALVQSDLMISIGSNDWGRLQKASSNEPKNGFPDKSTARNSGRLDSSFGISPSSRLFCKYSSSRFPRRPISDGIRSSNLLSARGDRFRFC